MDSMLQLKPGAPWLAGRHQRHHLLSQAQTASARAGAPAALPAISRWRPRAAPALPLPLLERLRQTRADCAFCQQLEQLAHSVARAERELPQLAASQPWQVRGSGLVLGGDALLASWHLLFMAGGVVLASPGRLGREFATYACHLSANTRQLQAALAGFTQLAQQAATPARQAALAELGQRLLAWGDALVEDELPDEVMLRVQNYPLLYEEMLDTADGGSDEAAASLESLGDADLLRLDWTGGQRRAVQQALERLRN
ncbi:hypothetical protein [Pseudoduganella sp.]|uniref:hypothetical protein n=1 Tax=Pseudoduganella sp. TaxID=1880898 RepID=UPI0035B30FBA